MNFELTSPITTIPTNVMRLWKPSDKANISILNPCGFHLKLIEKGWERTFQEGLWGEPSIDSKLEIYPNLCMFWIYGENANPGISGNYPRNMGGGPVRCSPRGPQELALMESFIPGFWKTFASRVSKSHAFGGSIMIYLGTPTLDIFPINSTVTKRNSIIDKMLNPMFEAGIGPQDYLCFDASAVCDQTRNNDLSTRPNKTQAMYIAERALLKTNVCVESHDQINPGLYPWFDGRFSCASTRYKNPDNSRWDLIHKDFGWFNSKMKYTNKTHFCIMTGAVDKDQRLQLLVENPVVNIIEMSDYPPEAFQQDAIN